ncbi:hypothetical protein JXD38_02575 [candidate division WOR-3 bacterium]|nr:hypothetical protein [candidate division WOR-3 bacterium]
MSIELSPERLDLSERAELRPQASVRDFVAEYGFADEPMAGKRPPRRNESAAASLCAAVRD